MNISSLAHLPFDYRSHPNTYAQDINRILQSQELLPPDKLSQVQSERIDVHEPTHQVSVVVPQLVGQVPMLGR